MPGITPTNPAIFHITHASNLQGILRDGCIWSDYERIHRSIASTNIGHKHIKDRRLKRPVAVSAGGTLGEYVPFNFCNRSVMLFAVSKGHADYEGGQDEVLHLVSSVNSAIATGQPWAFTDRHADLAYAIYFDATAHLRQVNWNVMPLTYWGNSDDTKEMRQAEFLVHHHFPWSSIEQIGVQSAKVGAHVQALLGGNCPSVVVEPGWYY
jgi:hypothetical protein